MEWYIKTKNKKILNKIIKNIKAKDSNGSIEIIAFSYAFWPNSNPF